MTLWTASEAAKATGGKAQGDWTVNGVSIDTRTIQVGDLFVALKAARDGHDFVAQALEKGAGAALVSHIPEGLPADAPLLIAEDVLGALEDLGRASRARMGGKVVAVTGSVGKTSTKEMLRTVLGGQGRVHASVASYNNHWGVPLTLARMPKDTEYAVIEIGMNHPGEIAPLAAMARPHVAVVTTVAPAHLEAFENVEGIALEKASIFTGLEENGTAIFNADLTVSPILQDIAAQNAKTLVAFGESDATFRLTDVNVTDSATVGTGTAHGQPLLYKVAVPGRHYAMNGLAVLAVADALALDPAIAITDLGRWEPGAGRGLRDIIQLDPADNRRMIELIDDAYNANPASVRASLEVLSVAELSGETAGQSARRIAYLGDMKELGPREKDLHREIADLASVEKIDRIHCIGPLMKELYDALPVEKRGRWTETSEEMAKGVARDLHAGDIVAAKGSLSMGVARVVDAIRKLGHPAMKLSKGTA
ncbi:UDP-N-acetylmuramoyl-tripeptide--D-alanyl-D-alanine ligase [Cognatishimia activa]|uniref:UDP-N-acetylmuramoyl-tripeptide--D-alanyl-D-alanine ligase n=1 Tax=Cognatishimia activa TaxID=1715691 RepID=A0A975EPQ0_9RHOB|nr:UDP-N-acetylmuramoyl-tripeptide--D-alanyl-D-alanine ligase [Cognatishimia activa]QTN35924.1 UDP-N-acetylmuramoyl-tripeptide--D-alanyl-D-alanine ligase [Cognatishimia activa]